MLREGDSLLFVFYVSETFLARVVHKMPQWLTPGLTIKCGSVAAGGTPETKN